MEMIKSYINLAIKLIKEYFVISIQLHRKERKILSFNYDNFSKLKILFKVASVFVLFFAGYSSAIAQNEVAMPGGFHQFGENSSDVIAASESIDSVTVGAIMQYWAQPNPALLNPANTYVWTISPTIGTQTAGTPTTLLQLHLSEHQPLVPLHFTKFLLPDVLLPILLLLILQLLPNQLPNLVQTLHPSVPKVREA